MAGRLSAMFELEMPNARQQGEQAGAAWSKGFSDAFRKLNPDFVAAMTGKAIRPPIEAHGPQGIQKLLNMGPLPVSSGVNWRQVMLGAAVSPFSPWIGARGIAGGLGGVRGGNGGGMGNALFGGNFGRFEAVFLGVQVAMKIFEYSVNKFKEVIERGFSLYVKAAQLGRSAGQLFSIQQAAAQVGISPEKADQFMLRGMWGKSRNSLQQFGTFKELGSLASDYKDAYKWASQIQGLWELNSRKTYEIHVNIMRMKEDWLAMWNNSSFLEDLGKLVAALEKVLHEINKSHLESQKFDFLYAWFAKRHIDFNTITQSGFPITPDMQNMMKQANAEWQKKIGGGESSPFNFSRQLPRMSSFEKMGFVIGSAKTRKETLLEQIRDGIIGMADKFVGKLYSGVMYGNEHHSYPGSSGNNINVP